MKFVKYIFVIGTVKVKRSFSYQSYRKSSLKDDKTLAQPIVIGDYIESLC